MAAAKAQAKAALLRAQQAEKLAIEGKEIPPDVIAQAKPPSVSINVEQKQKARQVGKLFFPMFCTQLSRFSDNIVCTEAPVKQLELQQPADIHKECVLYAISLAT